MYKIVQPIISKDDYRCWETAIVISQHRTKEKAFDVIAKENRAIRRTPGYGSARRDWYIIDENFELVQ